MAALPLPVLASGCSAAHEATDAGAIDASDLDAHVDARDAFIPDAHVPPDAPPPGDDGGPDAGPPDGDRDGIVTALDCDDTDPAVGRVASRECTSACAIGIESCSDGVWTPCDAVTECACDRPGTSRTIECGNCGIASQSCGADRMWTMPSECLDQGECAAGTIERDSALCGLSVRICDAECSWRPWEVRTPPGECEPGTTSITRDGCAGPGESRELTCNAMCAWEETTTCAARCWREPRTSRTGADPVCIPAGDFVLGHPFFEYVRPELTIALSEFYIDRLPVTRARYEACVTAGGCPDVPAGSRRHWDRTLPGDWAFGVSGLGARQFCVWDGGTLVSEYQWEKAARGPFPDRRLHPWGTDSDDCRFHAGPSCRRVPFDVDDFPEAVSPYGVRLIGSIPEWTNNHWYQDYRGLTDTVDPGDHPLADPWYMVVRSTSWVSMDSTPDDLMLYPPRGGSAIHRYYSSVDGYGGGFRCAY